MPGEEFPIKIAIEIAIELVKEALKFAEAAHKDKEDVRAMLEYLEAGRLAIWGLGQEREEILSDAAICDLEDKKRLRRLHNRVHKYLYTNRLRKYLEIVITGLEECHNTVEDHSKKIMQQLSPRAVDRKIELEKLYALLRELSSYVQSLQSVGDDKNRLNPSGPGLKQLLDLERALKQHLDLKKKALKQQHLDQARSQVKNAVDESLKDGVTNGKSFEITKKMEIVRARLRSAFA